MLLNEILNEINKAVYGNKSYIKVLHRYIIDNGIQQEIGEIILDTVALSVREMIPLTSTAKKLASRVIRKCKMPLNNYDDKQLIKIGADLIDYMAQSKLIKVEKHTIIEKNKVKESYFLSSKCADLTNYAANLDSTKFEPSLKGGPITWRGQTVSFGDGFTVDIVRKARRFGILSWFNKKNCPDFYSAANKLNKQEFIINQDILKLAKDHPFVPRKVSDNEKKQALIDINRLKRNANFVNELKFKEMHKWLDENLDLDDATVDRISQKRADEKSGDWLIDKSEDHLKIISDWSKRLDHDEIIKRAIDINGETINFLWNGDSRSRLYTVQNYLQPLGSDFAKALILFKQPMQVSSFDLCIHLANCFGNDKDSFEDRVQWVNENSEELYDIGLGKVTGKLFESLSSEKKTKWQGLASCIEYVRLMDHMRDNGSDEGFTTRIPVGLDATSSGVQILTLLGRDETVAEYVNISKTSNGKVGDFYQYLGDFLSTNLHNNRGSYSTRLENLLDVAPVGSKLWRKGAKRNGMTFAYSATLTGMGIQQFEDRKDYGNDEYANLTMSDCRVIGNEMYEVCKTKIKRAYELMQWMQQGIDYIDNSAIVSWTLPDGFRCFQVKDRSKRQQVRASIGNKTYQLVYYKWMDKPDKKAHKSAIAPDVVHSLDAYLLRYIVNNMPTDSNIVVCHDQFSVDSYYVQELQEIAKDAYRLIADRKVFKDMMSNCFGVDRELPQAGQYKLSSLDEAEFVIC